MSGNDYDSAVRVFSNIRSIRALARETDYAVLVDIAEKLNIVVSEMQEEEQEKQKKAEALVAKKKEAIQYLESLGLTLEDLTDAGSNSRRQHREPRPAKYQFTDEAGNNKQWTGQGRTPKALQKMLDGGKKLEDFLIS